ncbi:MAG: RNA-binding cell elongation regulator Jag/EloR [Sphaerochaeta sp.]|jgi:spoIIIJ-associated protein
MTREFEGRNEQDAIAKAIEELQIEREDFDVELLETVKKGFFKKNIRIRIHYNDGTEEEKQEIPAKSDAPLNSEFEQQVIQFVVGLLNKMGFPGKVTVSFRKDAKIGLNIESDYSSIIIGRKGKNLDAIQLLTNVFVGKIDPDQKVIIDSENYRMRHEEQIIRIAYKTAEQVKYSGKSRLLEPMNPFERRLVHTALNDFNGVDTKSEGDNLYKQIRVFPSK